MEPREATVIFLQIQAFFCTNCTNTTLPTATTTRSRWGVAPSHTNEASMPACHIGHGGIFVLNGDEFSPSSGGVGVNGENGVAYYRGDDRAFLNVRRSNERGSHRRALARG